MNSTGKLIQELRVKAGFTQKTLANALHITDKAVSKWERDICFPDVSLLPKLSLLLDIDLDVLITSSIEQKEWVGVIDIADCDFSQPVFDKPLINYLFSHFMLLGVNKIHILTNKHNTDFLLKYQYEKLGLNLVYTMPKNCHAMIFNHPWFLFGSDLTHQFQGAMLSGRALKMGPVNQPAVVLFAPKVEIYLKDKTEFARIASSRTLGRGMVCIDMGNYDNIPDVANIIKIYQLNSGLPIADLEEIARSMERTKVATSGKPQVG